MKKYIHRNFFIGLLVCMNLLFAIFVSSTSGYISIYGYQYICVKWCVQFVKMFFEGVLLIKAMRCFLTNKTMKKGVVYFCGAFILNFLGVYMGNLNSIIYAVQNFLQLVWPIIMIFVVLLLNKRYENSKKKIWKYKTIFYWGIVIVGVYFIEECLAYSYIWKRDVFFIIYLLWIAVLVWGRMVGQWGISGFIAVLAGGLMIGYKERTQEIIRSLSNPMIAIEGEIENVNWLANRIVMMKEIDLMRIVIILSMILFTLAYIKLCDFKLCMRENEDVWHYIIGVASVLRCILSLVAEILIIRTTKMSFPILDGKFDFIVLLMLYEFFDKRSTQE